MIGDGCEGRPDGERGGRWYKDEDGDRWGREKRGKERERRAGGCRVPDAAATATAGKRIGIAGETLRLKSRGRALYDRLGERF